MGSEITLEIGKLRLDWGKNNGFFNHSALYQQSDAQLVPYDYVGEDDQRIVEMQEVYARPLKAIAPRVELLGHTLKVAREAFDYWVDEPRLTFEQLLDAIAHVELDEDEPDFDTLDSPFVSLLTRTLIERLGLNPDAPGLSDTGQSLANTLEHFHPWTVLRLLATDPKNADRQVIWRFADVVDGGWVEREDIVRELSQERRFLIVTEGSSDTKILTKALALLRPEIADFFYFIDMEEGYPFTGTGNLYRFCQGLVSIGILNQIVILYDNDAEGSARYADTTRLKIPENMRVTRLPNLPSLENFKTIGPTGEGHSNINGCAAAIECYLDLNWKTTEAPAVRWTSFNHGASRYQGELVNKEHYTRSFLSLRRLEPSYDMTNISLVLNALIGECVSLAERKLYR